MSLPDIQRLVLAQFRLDGMGAHGLPHWQRVYKVGMKIADHDPTVDRMVVAHFAYLHDSQREDEYDDVMHGARGSDYVLALRLEGHLDHLTETQTTQLSAAVCDHSRGFLAHDRTIQACWDADRIDLTRFGIRPDIKLLGSAYALTPGVVDAHWDEAWVDDEL